MKNILPLKNVSNLQAVLLLRYTGYLKGSCGFSEVRLHKFKETKYNKMNIKNQILGIDQKDFDRSIYRVFTLDRFMQLFDNKKVTLVKPEMWEDPFENFIMKASAKTVAGDEFKIGFRDDFYGQCWTLQKESDAMWRIYAKKKNGVKVKTTIRKLITALYESCNDFPELSCFIGKVEYLRKEKIKEILTDPEFLTSYLLDSTGKGQVKTLLIKRFAFEHEKEVRIVFHDQKRANPLRSQGLYQFEINPYDLIEEITFDPRMDKVEYNNYCQDLKKRGYKNKIIRSGLYEIPDIHIQLNV